MKSLFKKAGIIICMLLISISIFSEERNALGIRLSDNFGITYKFNYQSNTVLEGIVGLPDNAIFLTGLYEKYYKIEGVKGLNWYVGGGVFLGINTSSFGIAGILGLCYTFPDIPLDASLDWLPRLRVTDSGYLKNTIGLSVRYRF